MLLWSSLCRAGGCVAGLGMGSWPFISLLGDDEERKARGSIKIRKGRNVEAYDAGEIRVWLVSACNSYLLFAHWSVRNLDARNAGAEGQDPGYLWRPVSWRPTPVLRQEVRRLGEARRSEEVGEVQKLRTADWEGALARWAVGLR